jgi:ribonuclease HI
MNNEAEYEAIIAKMGVARDMRAKKLEVRSDSQVVVGHIRGEYEARGEKMKWYLAKVQELWVSFDKMVLTRLPLENNTRVDSLARLGSVTDEEIEASDQQVLILTEPSITPTIKVL